MTGVRDSLERALRERVEAVRRDDQETVDLLDQAIERLMLALPEGE